MTDLCQPNAFIDGEFVTAQSGRRYDVRNPATGEIIENVSDCDRDDAIRAISAAVRAQAAWRAVSAQARAAILEAWHALVVERKDELAHLLTLECGKPLLEAKGEILYGASYIKLYAEEAKRVIGDVIPSPIDGRRMLVVKQPIGVVAAITPWNFPNAMITRKVAPALAAGCAIVVKPAADTPLSALALTNLATKAGLPDGLLSILPCDNPVEVGNEITTHPDVRKISFTGSTNLDLTESEIPRPSIDWCRFQKITSCSTFLK